MAAKEEKNGDFYSVLGLKKECTALELRNAYKKLALRWHPDRLSASGNSKFVEEAKKNFQAIQEAYSVLSDANKRFMYDVGVYDSDDDENGMGEFLGEMAAMMSQTAANEEDSLEDIQELFEEMFQRDIDTFGSTFSRDSSASSSCSNNKSINKRNCDDMRSEETNLNEFSTTFDKEDSSDVRNFCFGSRAAEETEESRGRSRGGGGGKGRKRRSGRKQKLSSGHDVSSSRDSRISAG